MFRAAQAVGPQTRPLLIFYGLSQAGRAIAAAAVSLKGEDWNLVSHGIKTLGLDENFPDIGFRTDPQGSSGSFVRLSELLDSPVWGKGQTVRLEDLWDATPGSENYPLSPRDRATPLTYKERFSYPGLTLEVGPLPDRTLEDDNQAALDAFLASYPCTAGYAAHAPCSSLEKRPRNWRELNWEWQPNEQQRIYAAWRRALFKRVTRRKYAKQPYIFPAPTGLSEELHPLMGWWALLYALSMLARYQPSQWAAYIDVDKSPHAVPIEKFLERSMEHLPVLIADTIDEVATWK